MSNQMLFYSRPLVERLKLQLLLHVKQWVLIIVSQGDRCRKLLKAQTATQLN